MDIFLDEDFEKIHKLKQELKQEDNELKALLNKKNLSSFELDAAMNEW